MSTFACENESSSLKSPQLRTLAKVRCGDLATFSERLKPPKISLSLLKANLNKQTQSCYLFEFELRR